MSHSNALFDDGYGRSAPGTAAYKRREEIPKKDRCTHCDALGLVCWRKSMTGHDYRVCFWCHGTGKKDHELEKHLGKSRSKRDS